MATDYTPNYNLDKYVATDKPNLRDQYNAAMDKIDLALLSANTNATEAKATTQGFQSAIDEIEDTIAPYSSSNTIQSAINGKASQTALTALTTRVSLLENPNIVLLGDSWAAFNEGFEDWYTAGGIGNVFHATLFNYAVGGAGFIMPNKPISAQVATANSAMTTEQKNNTQFVLIVCGVNDTSVSGATYSAWFAAFEGVINNLKTIFPYAQIIYIPNMMGVDHGNNAATRIPMLYSWLNYLTRNIKYNPNCKVKIAQGFPYFWLGQPCSLIFRPDQLHLNVAGANGFGNAVLNAMLGGNIEPYCMFLDINTTDASSNTHILRLSISNDGIFEGHGELYLSDTNVITLYNTQNAFMEALNILPLQRRGGGSTIDIIPALGGFPDNGCWIRRGGVQLFNWTITARGSSANGETYYF